MRAKTRGGMRCHWCSRKRGLKNIQVRRDRALSKAGRRVYQGSAEGRGEGRGGTLGPRSLPAFAARRHGECAASDMVLCLVTLRWFRQYKTASTHLLITACGAAATKPGRGLHCTCSHKDAFKRGRRAFIFLFPMRCCSVASLLIRTGNLEGNTHPSPQTPPSGLRSKG